MESKQNVFRGSHQFWMMSMNFGSHHSKHIASKQPLNHAALVSPPMLNNSHGRKSCSKSPKVFHFIMFQCHHRSKKVLNYVRFTKWKCSQFINLSQLGDMKEFEYSKNPFTIVKIVGDFILTEFDITYFSDIKII